MMPADLSQLLLVLSSRAPYWAVVLFGAFLCFRNTGRKPREVRLASIALALMVAGSVASYVIVPLLKSMGLNLMARGTGWWLISSVLALPQALSLALLFWAIFGDFVPYEEPVFRYDNERGVPER